VLEDSIPGEDIPLSTRADPRAGGHAAVTGRTGTSRLRAVDRTQPEGPVLEASLRTPVFVRVSTWRANKGPLYLAAMTCARIRDKFYTRQGTGTWSEQHPGFLNTERHQFPDGDPRGQAGADRGCQGLPEGPTAHENFWDFCR